MIDELGPGTKGQSRSNVEENMKFLRGKTFANLKATKGQIFIYKKALVDKLVPKVQADVFKQTKYKFLGHS